ncbi:hypothetical protein GJ744_007092 [Endocarpon pusillum]|uniref:AAA+ ATPase domain-containing protein n=1 Tax=Endocarpon pusillum TaxID=364733 RepID=A0A8H7E6N6_9EURO|nr:hypothetical protein GJ744_007092 [Endocarpon pusillum]
MFKKYAQAGLSKRSDKEVAILGLLERIQHILDSEYVYGTFSCFLSRLLLWRVSSITRNAADDSEDVNLPSWSWMSHDHIDFFPEESILVPVGINKFHLKQLQVEVFELLGPLVEVEHNEGHLAWHEDGEEAGTFWFDTHEKTPIRNCVVVGRSKSEHNMVFFVLLVTGTDENRYKRFGVGQVKPKIISKLSIEGILAWDDKPTRQSMRSVVEFAIVGVEGIKWNMSAFDDLVLPEVQKDMALALAETKIKELDDLSFDDVVKGKGQGLSMLLHGPPGVGKTLTAELLSEHLQKPLYIISAGELSTDPGTLEYRLRNIFELGRRWGIPLLLDEADVYLEQRKTEHIVRHSLVSVFLRMMEYFRGILILTTNRVGVFDEAILSRIHMKLRYDRLDKNARMTVWKNLFKKVNTRSVTAEISQQELDELVKKDLNGRQIKNAISTASALATKKKKPLSISHVQAVLTAGEMFDRDFHGTDRSESLYS